MARVGKANLGFSNRPNELEHDEIRNPEKMGNLLGYGGLGKTMQLSEAVASKYTLGFIGSRRSDLKSSSFSFRLFLLGLFGRENLNSRFET